MGDGGSGDRGGVLAVMMVIRKSVQAHEKKRKKYLSLTLWILISNIEG